MIVERGLGGARPTTCAVTASRRASAASSIASTSTSTTSQPRSRRRAQLAPGRADRPARPLARQPDHAARAVRASGLREVARRDRRRRRTSASSYAVPGYKKLLARVASRLAPKLAQPNVASRTSRTTREAGRARRRQAVLRHRDRPLVHRVVGGAGLRRSSTPNRIKIPTTWLVGRRRSDRRPGASKTRRSARTRARLSRPRRDEARGLQRGRPGEGVRAMLTRVPRKRAASSA